MKTFSGGPAANRVAQCIASAFPMPFDPHAPVLIALRYIRYVEHREALEVARIFRETGGGLGAWGSTNPNRHAEIFKGDFLKPESEWTEGVHAIYMDKRTRIVMRKDSIPNASEGEAN